MKQNRIVFSVLVLTYNQKDYIAQTLDSILEQEHDYAYEIIVGDDYSTDGTRDILHAFKEKYPDIITLILNEKNMGLIKNYFNVVRHCSGKYIMQCAGDDYWLPGKVALQIPFMEANPDVAMCCTWVRVWNERIQRVSLKPVGGVCHSFERLLFKGNNIFAVTICIKSICLSQYIQEIQPERKTWVMEDYPIVLWVSLEYKIRCIDKATAVYREFENSASHSTDVNKLEKYIDSANEIRLFFAKLSSITIPHDLENEKYLTLAYVSLKNNNYNSYKRYVSMCTEKTIKTNIKKLIAKSHILFQIYRWYVTKSK